MLCEAGCYKDIPNKYGVTPLYEAALKGEHFGVGLREIISACLDLSKTLMFVCSQILCKL